MPEPESELLVHCGQCGECWIAAYLPQPLDLLGAVLRNAYCPRCLTTSGRIFMGAAPSELLERLAQERERREKREAQ